MKITDAAVEAVAKALNPELWAEESLVPEVLRHSARWQKRHDVRAALLAAQPHLTDDGAAATPPADKGVRSAQAAESATPVGAGAAAPSSPHLEDWTEEERGFVEIALSAADSGNAGHWPTVAAYLAAEVRRLRAGEGGTPGKPLREELDDWPEPEGTFDEVLERAAQERFEGATPAINREALDAILRTHTIECTGPGEVTCRGCRDLHWMSWQAYRRHISDAIMALIKGAS